MGLDLIILIKVGLVHTTNNQFPITNKIKNKKQQPVFVVASAAKQSPNDSYIHRLGIASEGEKSLAKTLN